VRAAVDEREQHAPALGLVQALETVGQSAGVDVLVLRAPSALRFSDGGKGRIVDRDHPPG